MSPGIPRHLADRSAAADDSRLSRLAPAAAFAGAAASHGLTTARTISRYRVKADIDAPAVRRSDWRSVIRRFPAQEVRVACDVGLRCANPTCNPASVKCSRTAADASGKARQRPV